MLASWVSKRRVGFEAGLRDLKKRGSGGGGGVQPSPPHTRKHNARIINVEQTLIFEASLRDLKSGGVGGGRSPPFANTILAPWLPIHVYALKQACAT